MGNSDPQSLPKRAGRIQLVGAGPGSADFLTVAAVRAIKEADIVIADRLIPKETLALVRGELRISRKRPGKADEAQAELYDWGLDALLQGKRVVRMKNGDPFLYGRGGEEVLFFREHGFEAEVIPGVTSALSAPLLANIPATNRGVADQVLICTGHRQAGDLSELPPYSNSRTIMFLMAIGSLQDLCDKLLEIGYPDDCPVAVVENASTAEQVAIKGTIASIFKDVEARGIQPPAVVVLGDVVNVLHTAEMKELTHCPYKEALTTEDRERAVEYVEHRLKSVKAPSRPSIILSLLHIVLVACSVVFAVLSSLIVPKTEASERWTMQLNEYINAASTVISFGTIKKKDEKIQKDIT